MGFRMDKYENLSEETLSRTKRNQHIYNSNDMSELSRIKTNTNVSVISDAKKEIDIDKIKKFINSIDDKKENHRRNIEVDIPNDNKEKEVTRVEIKNHDINSVLEEAKEKKEIDYEEERHRQIGNTGYNILKEIKIYEENIEQDNNKVQAKTEIKTEQLNTEEKTIVDLIQDIKNNSSSNSKKEENEEYTKEDLFQELMGDAENTVVMEPIDSQANKDNLKELLLNLTSDLENIKLQTNNNMSPIEEKEVKKPKISEIDKSFYTNSLTFDKKDFEGLEDIDSDNKKNKVTKIIVIVIIIILIISILLILNSIFNII